MAKKDGSNLFAEATSRRQAEQDALKRGLAQDVAADAEPVDDPRVKLTLALSNSDKIKLKTIAVKRGITVAKLVHEWIETLE